MSEPSYRLPQQRRIVTALPGPVSLSLAGRRNAVVSAGVASSSPCYVVGADGGILVDADGNQLIDLGAGIAVTTVGASAPAVVAAVAQRDLVMLGWSLLVGSLGGMVFAMLSDSG